MRYFAALAEEVSSEVGPCGELVVHVASIGARRRAAMAVLRPEHYVTLLTRGMGERLVHEQAEGMGTWLQRDVAVHCPLHGRDVGLLVDCGPCAWRGPRARDCGWPYVAGLR